MTKTTPPTITTKINKTPGEDEYRVRLFIDNVYQKEADCFETSRDDANATAKQMEKCALKRWEATDEGRAYVENRNREMNEWFKEAATEDVHAYFKKVKRELANLLEELEKHQRDFIDDHDKGDHKTAVHRIEWCAHRMSQYDDKATEAIRAAVRYATTHNVRH